MAEQAAESEHSLGEDRQLFPCTICGRTFLPAPLARHMRVCERSAIKKRKVFDSLKQRVEGTDIAQFHAKTYLKRPEPTAIDACSDKWKEQHLELVSTIRTAKSIPNQMALRRGSSTVIGVSQNERCPTCDRQFGLKAYDRHVEWCKERKTSIHKSPASVLMAKEKLEARTKYKVPPLNKSRRAHTREKYSPQGGSMESSKSVTAVPLERNPSIKRTDIEPRRSLSRLGQRTYCENTRRGGNSSGTSTNDERRVLSSEPEEDEKNEVGGKRQTEHRSNRRQVRSVPCLTFIPKINSSTNINVQELAVCPVTWPDEPHQKNMITWKNLKKLREKINDCGVKNVEKSAPEKFEICSTRKIVDECPKLRRNATDIGVATIIVPTLQSENIDEIHSVAFRNRDKSKKRTADNKCTSSEKIRDEENMEQTLSSSRDYCSEFVIERKEGNDQEQLTSLFQNFQNASSVSRTSLTEVINKNLPAEYKEYSFGLSFENCGNIVTSACEENDRSVSKLPMLAGKNFKTSGEQLALQTEHEEEHIDVTLQKKHEAKVNREESNGDIIDTSILKSEMCKSGNQNNNICEGNIETKWKLCENLTRLDETCKNCSLADEDITNTICIEKETAEERDYKKVRSISSKLVSSADDVLNENIMNEGEHNKEILKCRKQKEGDKFYSDNFICERSQSPCKNKLQSNVHVARQLVCSDFKRDNMKNAPENISPVEDGNEKLHISGSGGRASRGNDPNIISSSKSNVDDELTLQQGTINEERLCKKIEMEELKKVKLDDEISSSPSTNALGYIRECDESDHFYKVEFDDLGCMNPTIQGEDKVVYTRPNKCGSHDTDSLIWGNDDEYSEALSMARLQKGTRECYSDINVVKTSRNEKFSTGKIEEHLDEVCARNEQESEENLKSGEILNTPRFVISLVAGNESNVNAYDVKENYEKSSVSKTSNYESICNITGDKKSNSCEDEQVVSDKLEILENSKKNRLFACEDLTTVREDGEITEGITETSNQEVEDMNVSMFNSLMLTDPFDVDNKIPILNTSTLKLFKNSSLEQDSQIRDKHERVIVDFKDVLIKNIELIKFRKILKDIDQGNTILRSLNYQDGSINIHENFNMLDDESFVSRGTLSTIEEIQTHSSKSDDMSKTLVDERVVGRISLFDHLKMESRDELKACEELEQFDDNEGHVSDFDLHNANNNDPHPDAAPDIPSHIEQHNGNIDITAGKEVETLNSEFDGCRYDEEYHVVASIMKSHIEEELTKSPVEQIVNSRCFLRVKFEDDLAHRRRTQGEISLKQFRSDNKLENNFSERISPRNSLHVMWEKHSVVSLGNYSPIFSNDYFDTSLDKCFNSSSKQRSDTILENNCQTLFKTQFQLPKLKMRNTNIKLEDAVRKSKGVVVRNSRKSVDLPIQELIIRDHDDDEKLLMEQLRNVDDEDECIGQFKLPELKMGSAIGKQILCVNRLQASKVLKLDNDSKDVEDEIFNDSEKPVQRYLMRNNGELSSSVASSHETENGNSCAQTEDAKNCIYCDKKSNLSETYKVDLKKQMTLKNCPAINLNDKIYKQTYKTEVFPPTNKCDGEIFSLPLIPNVAFGTEITNEDMTNKSIDDGGQPLTFQEMNRRSVNCSENLCKDMSSETHVMRKWLKNHDDSGKKVLSAVFHDNDGRCYQKVNIERTQPAQLEKPVHLDKYSTNQAQENITNEKTIIKKWPNNNCREDEEETDIEINCSHKKPIFSKKPAIMHLEKHPDPRTNDATKSQASSDWTYPTLAVAGVKRPSSEGHDTSGVTSVNITPRFLEVLEKIHYDEDGRNMLSVSVDHCKKLIHLNSKKFHDAIHSKITKLPKIGNGIQKSTSKVIPSPSKMTSFPTIKDASNDVHRLKPYMKYIWPTCGCEDFKKKSQATTSVRTDTEIDENRPQNHRERSAPPLLHSAYSSPFAKAEKQLLELLELDDFPTPSPLIKEMQNRPHTSPVIKSKSNTINSYGRVTKPGNIRKGNETKMSSVINPPVDFKDKFSKVDEDFELIENLIDDMTENTAITFSQNINMNKNFATASQNDTIHSEAYREKYAEDYSVIDPYLINENDDLSIPETLNLEGTSPLSLEDDNANTSCTANHHVLKIAETRSFKRSNSLLDDMESLGDIDEFVITLNHVGDHSQQGRKDGSCRKHELFKGRRSLFTPRNVLDMNKSKGTIEKSNISLNSSSKKRVSAAAGLKRSVSLLDPEKKAPAVKSRLEECGKIEQVIPVKKEKIKSISKNETPKLDDLFSIDDELYEEYKKYEEMYLKEKREEEMKIEPNLVQNYTTVSKVETEGDEYQNVNRANSDSAYGSLTRKVVKVRARSTKLTPLESQHNLVDSSSSSESELATLPTLSAVLPSKTSPESRMSKYCHECGSKHPLASAKFCIECGVKRLVL